MHPHFINKKRRLNEAVFFLMLRAVSAVPVLDELVEAIPSVVVFMLGQVVVEGRVNGFDVGLDRMADDI